MGAKHRKEDRNMKQYYCEVRAAYEAGLGNLQELVCWVQTAFDFNCFDPLEQEDLLTQINLEWMSLKDLALELEEEDW